MKSIKTWIRVNPSSLEDRKNALDIVPFEDLALVDQQIAGDETLIVALNEDETVSVGPESWFSQAIRSEGEVHLYENDNGRHGLEEWCSRMSPEAPVPHAGEGALVLLRNGRFEVFEKVRPGSFHSRISALEAEVFKGR